MTKVEFLSTVLTLSGFNDIWILTHAKPETIVVWSFPKIYINFWNILEVWSQSICSSPEEALILLGQF